MYRRGRRLKYASVAVLGLIFVGLGAWVAASAISGDADPAGIAALVISAIALAMDASVLIRDLQPVQPQTSTTLADGLAEVARDELEEEARARRLRDPRVLPVSWTETKRDVKSEPSTVTRGNLHPSSRLKSSGHLQLGFDESVHTLARAYRGIPSGRLVILGEPGSGKSALALMLAIGLLQSRSSGSPVAVLLSASSWDPVNQRLDEWIENSLAANYYNGDSEISRRLYKAGCLIPIVDGLDEIPESHRRPAVRAINLAVGTTKPLIVTCRSTEYDDLIQGGSPTLHRAPVVEVDPLSPKEVAGYLESTSSPGQTSWSGAARTILTETDGPLAQALSTPLMVSLARTHFERLGGDPLELADLRKFESRHAVEDYLTGHIVEAAYSSDPQGASTSRWTPAQAGKFLTFLAHYLHVNRDRDLLWWLLAPRLLTAWASPVIGIASGLLLMILTSASIEILDVSDAVSIESAVVIGAAIGVVYTILVVVVWYASSGRPPGQLLFTRRNSRKRFIQGFVAGAKVCGVLLGPVLLGVTVIISILDAWTTRNIAVYLTSVGAGILFTAAIGTAIGVHSWLNAPANRAGSASPLSTMMQDRRSSYLGSACAGIVAAALVLPAIGLGMLLGRFLGKQLTGWAGWFDTRSLTGVGHTVGRDIHSVFTSTPLLIGGAVVLPGIIVATLMFLTRAWPRFLILRLVSVLRWRLPWQFPAFLLDARERNIFRQSAGAYQFRHARLQESLANQQIDATWPSAEADVPVRVALRMGRGARALLAAALLIAGLLLAPKVVPRNSAQATLAGEYGIADYLSTVSEGEKSVLLAAYSKNDATVRIWDVRTGRLLAPLSNVQGGISAVRFAQDGRSLAVQAAGKPGLDPSDDDISLWSSKGWAIALGIDYVVMLAGGRSVLGIRGDRTTDPADNEFELIDAHSGNPLKRFSAAEWDPIVNYYYSYSSPRWLDSQRQETFIMRDKFGLFHLFSAVDGAELAVLTDAENVPEYTPNGTALYLRSAGGIKLWDAKSGRFIGILNNATDLSVGAETALAVSQDGRSAEIVDVATGAVVAQCGTHDNLGSMNVTADGAHFWKAASAERGGERQLLIVDARTCLVTSRIAGVSDYNFIPSYSPKTEPYTSLLGDEDLSYPSADVILVYSSTDAGTITRVLNLRTGQVGAPLGGRLDPNLSPTDPSAKPTMLSQDGRYAAVRESEDLLKLVDATTGAPLIELSATDLILTDTRYAPNSSRFSPDGSIFAAVYSNKIILVDTTYGHRIAELGNMDLQEQSGLSEGLVSFSPDSRFLAVVQAGGESVMVLEASSARLRETFHGHSGHVRSMRYLTDARTLVTSFAADGTVRVWRLPD